MSKNLWDEEPFRDTPIEYKNGKWEEGETYTPAPENVLRPKPNLHVNQKEVEEMRQEDLDELTDQVAQDEEDEDYTEVLSDARLRLEQGKLYEMIMNHNLFDGVESDPRAAKSVQKQIRTWAKNQMEIMLGMRQEVSESSQIISSPFNELEVSILKKLASAASKGATESEEANKPESKPELPPKKKSLNSIGKNDHKTRVIEQAKPIQKKTTPIERSKSSLRTSSQLEKGPKVLTGKLLSEMNEEEKSQYLLEVTERNEARKQVIPADRAPMPDYATQEMLAISQVSRATAGGSGVAALNGKLSSLIINNAIKRT